MQGALSLASRIKKSHPDSLVILGGFTSTFFAREIIKDHQYVDAVIMGEAEEALLEFAGTVDSSKSFLEVPNLCFRNNGTVKVNPLAKPVEVLTSMNSRVLS